LELSGTISMQVHFPTTHIDQGLMLQSAAIGPGDSGSAVVDAADQVVGMVIDGGNGITLASQPSAFGGFVRRAVGRTAGVATGACA
jgi:V8-like Glu-specific endopeptidase